MSQNNDNLEAYSDLIKYYRTYPSMAAYDLLGVELPVVQQVILDAMWFNKFTIITAGRGTGKCISGDSLVPTSEGFFEIGELGSELNPLIDLNTQVVGYEGLNTTVKWYYDGIQPVNKVRTSWGYSISGTDAHSIKVLDSSGRLAWKKVSDIVVGDVVAINRARSLWSSSDKCSEDAAVVMGLLVGDGCFRGNKNNILSGDKVIPSSVLRSGKRVMAAFLRGLFEVDGGCEKACVSYTSKSKRLAHQVHTVLLNFGIVSYLKSKRIKYKGSVREYWTIKVSSSSIDTYQKEVGFLSSRKRASLESLCSIKRNPNKDVIYNNEAVFEEMWLKTLGVLDHQARKIFDKHFRYYNPSYETLLKCIKRYPFDDGLKEHLVDLHTRNYFFDRVVSNVSGLDKVYDFVVAEDDHSFVANGFVNHNTFLLSTFAVLKSMLYPGTRVGLIAPSFRQSKLVFEEVRKLWYAAPIFREATAKRPTFQSDRCILEYRSVSAVPASMIEAVPLGTGEKIRGARFHVILADEFAQLPEEIFDAVIKPMAATASNPMERVKQVARLHSLRELGVSEEELEGQLSTNTIIMASSAYYKFNHMYSRIVEYEKLIEKGKPGFSVVHANYLDMPTGFMNDDIIEEAKSTMPASLFRMEYLGMWESDSDGVFKASLLQSRILPPGDSVVFSATASNRYVIACDPARTNDFFAVVVFELQGGRSKVCYAEHTQGVKFPAMADRLMDVCAKFNPEFLLMDSQGGGLAIKDLLADGTRYGNRIILDINDDEYYGVEGRHILEMVNPSPNVNSECVWATLGLLENSKLFFAGYPTSGKEDDEFVYDSIRELIHQLLAIVVTSTKSGQAHFDVPTGGGHSVQKKDLFSAFVYGGRKLAELERGLDNSPVLWTNGVVYDRRVVPANTPNFGTISRAISSAVLKQVKR